MPTRRQAENFPTGDIIASGDMESEVKAANTQDVKSVAARKRKSVKLYTDGACLKNPGPGGYGVVLIYGSHRKELSAGFRKTTNNRMELMAAIAGLEALKEPCQVTLYSDSQYLVEAMQQGWARRWQRNGWMRNKKEKALNPDLWERLLKLCSIHDVKFQWIRGHAGAEENERCDQLATSAAKSDHLAIDEVYERESP